MRRLPPIPLALVIATALIVPIVIFAAFARSSIDAEVGTRAQLDRESSAALAADVVRQRLDDEVSSLARFAARADVAEGVRRGDVGALEGALREFTSPWSFKLAGIVGPDGSVLAHVPDGAVDPTFATEMAARAAALAPPSDWAYVRPDERPPTNSGAVAVLVVPLRIGERTWAVYGTLDCAPFSSLFVPLRLPGYRTVALLDERGGVVATNPGNTATHACLDVISWPGLHSYSLAIPGAMEALSSDLGGATFAIDGTEYLAVHAPVLPGHWVMYLLDSREEALAGERALTQQITIGATAAALVALALALALAWLIDRQRRQGGQLARLAVTEERLRFARDLHDLLGRGLSLIAMKADLAGRVLSTDVAGAQREIDDVERVAREALRDMRDALVGYRQPSLSMELSAARSVLEAAGLRCRIDRGDAALPGAVDTLFAWAVREGVTNVVRHSRAATSCRIQISRDLDEARVEITDDGVAATAHGGGHGLLGLSERAAARGGKVDAGPLPDRGFRLRIAAPLSAT